MYVVALDRIKSSTWPLSITLIPWLISIVSGISFCCSTTSWTGSSSSSVSWTSSLLSSTTGVWICSSASSFSGSGAIFISSSLSSIIFLDNSSNACFSVWITEWSKFFSNKSLISCSNSFWLFIFSVSNSILWSLCLLLSINSFVIKLKWSSIWRRYSKLVRLSILSFNCLIGSLFFSWANGDFNLSSLSFFSSCAIIKNLLKLYFLFCQILLVLIPFL